MAYCTRSAYTARYGERELRQLTDRTSEAETVVEHPFNRVVGDVDSEIDAVLESAGYILPLLYTPAILTRHACSMVRYFLHTGRRTDEIVDDYKAATVGLSNTVAGKVKLPSDAVNGGQVRTTIASGERTMVYTTDFWKPSVLG